MQCFRFPMVARCRDAMLQVSNVCLLPQSNASGLPWLLVAAMQCFRFPMVARSRNAMLQLSQTRMAIQSRVPKLLFSLDFFFNLLPAGRLFKLIFFWPHLFLVRFRLIFLARRCSLAYCNQQKRSSFWIKHFHEWVLLKFVTFPTNLSSSSRLTFVPKFMWVVKTWHFSPKNNDFLFPPHLPPPTDCSTSPYPPLFPRPTDHRPIDSPPSKRK